MGFPLEINNYTVFDALSEGQRHPLYNEVKSAISPFKLFVFIIHNPKKNTSFDHYLNSDFPVLDSASGRDLLFFSIVNQNTFNVREFIQNKHFQFQNLKCETSEFLENQNNVVLKNEDTSSFFITKLLKINYENLPLLIITNNLQSNRIVYFKTSEKYLLKQMAYLGNLACFLNYQSKLIYHEIKEIDFENISGEVVLDKNLSDYLSYFYSIATYIPFKTRYWKDDAKDNSISTLNSFETEIENSKIPIEKKDEDDFIENETKNFSTDFYEKNLIYSTSLSLKSLSENKQRPNRFDSYETKDFLFKIVGEEVLDDIIFLKDFFLEEESKIILETARDVSRIFKKDSYLYQRTSLDYTPLVICLVKIFEIEISLSVVHWIRKKLKIRLPEFFNKVEPCVEAILPLTIQHHNIIVDFNRGSENIWLSPGLGESRLSFKELQSEFMKYTYWRKKMRFHPQTLLNHWEIIRRQRNKAAHRGVLTNEDYNIVRNSINYLSERKVFEKLYNMKSKFRGHTLEKI